MNFFSDNRIYDFMKVRRLFLSISVLFLAKTLILLFTKGISFGVDFAGGTLVQVQYDQPAPIKTVREKLSQDELMQNAFVTEFGSPNEIVIKVSIANEDVAKDTGDIIKKLLEGTGNFEIRRVDLVGAKVGSEMRSKGIIAILLSIIILLVYIGFRFEWRFSIASILALLHDVGITIGIIIIVGIDFNLDILAAILMILGYSLNDTIIVFDRVREELKESKTYNLKEIINSAVSKTLSRTTLTSVTTLFVVLTLYLFGGEILNGFALTLLVGIIVGTYSSIFIASSLLILLQFSVKNFRDKESEKLKVKQEKQRLRSLYEQGVV